VESQLVAAGDGRLDLPAAMRLSAHLEECAACRARAALWRQLVPGMRALVPDAPDAMRGRRMQIQVERQLALARPPQPAAGWRRLRWSLGLGLAASAAVVALLWWRSARAPGPPAAFATVLRVDGALSDGARPLAASAALAANSEIALAGAGRAEL